MNATRWQVKMSHLEKVLTVRQGIASRDLDLASEYTDPEKYTEHLGNP